MFNVLLSDCASNINMQYQYCKFGAQKSWGDCTEWVKLLIYLEMLSQCDNWQAVF